MAPWQGSSAADRGPRRLRLPGIEPTRAALSTPHGSPPGAAPSLFDKPFDNRGHMADRAKLPHPSIRSGSMATKQERGTKRTCQNGECGARFYDLNRSPITCPICGTKYVIASSPVAVAAWPRKSRPRASPRRRSSSQRPLPAEEAARPRRRSPTSRPTRRSPTRRTRPSSRGRGGGRRRVEHHRRPVAEGEQP